MVSKSPKHPGLVEQAKIQGDLLLQEANKLFGDNGSQGMKYFLLDTKQRHALIKICKFHGYNAVITELENLDEVVDFDLK